MTAPKDKEERDERPKFGDVPAAKEAFEREWNRGHGPRLSDQDKRLASVAFCLGWMASEARFLQVSAPAPKE